MLSRRGVNINNEQGKNVLKKNTCLFLLYPARFPISNCKPGFSSILYVFGSFLFGFIPCEKNLWGIYFKDILFLKVTMCLQRPKSDNFICPLASISILSGFRSRWI